MIPGIRVNLWSAGTDQFQLNLRWFQDLYKFSFLLIFFGGLIRLLSMDFNVIFGQDILGSLLSEIFGMPLLFLWLNKATAPMKE